MNRLLLILLILIMCGCARLTEGVVVEKRFVAAHTDHYVTPVTVGKMTIYTNNEISYPDDWRLKIENDNKTCWVSVDLKTFNRAVIGSYWRKPVEEF